MEFGITGEYNNTLDEKGRIAFPAKIRSDLPESRLIVTRGIEKCLLAFTPAEWGVLSTKVRESASLFKKQSRSVSRRLIAPAQDIDLDKAGRLSIPQSLREYAGLEKDCVILGLGNYFEIWDAKEYESYLEESEPDFLEAAEALGELGL